MRAGATAAAMCRIVLAGSESAASPISHPSSVSLMRSTPGTDFRTIRSAAASKGSKQDRTRIVLAAQPGHRLVQYLAALVNHHDLLAQLLGMRHDMGGEDDGRAALLLLGNQLLQQAHAHRIQAAEGLVENQQVGLMNDGGDELHPLQHALGQVLALLGSGVGKTEPPEQLRRARLDACARSGAFRPPI